MLIKIFLFGEKYADASRPSCFSSAQDLELINSQCDHGGLIGPGKKELHLFLKRFKLLRRHAAFQNVFGFMKRQ